MNNKARKLLFAHTSDYPTITILMNTCYRWRTLKWHIVSLTDYLILIAAIFKSRAACNHQDRMYATAALNKYEFMSVINNVYLWLVGLYLACKNFGSIVSAFLLGSQLLVLIYGTFALWGCVEIDFEELFLGLTLKRLKMCLLWLCERSF